MSNDFDLTNGTMSPPWWSVQLILEVVIRHWNFDDVYTDDDTDDDDDEDDDDDDDNDDDTDDDTDDEAIWLWWW